MQVEWYGQSAFALSAAEATVFIDPFGDLSGLGERGMQFDYPPIKASGVDLVLITHEHVDHNALEAIAGEPAVLRSTAGRLLSPIGEVLAIASEHDEVAGTQRGPNTIFVFELGGVRVAHFGDFGQRELRSEQADAIGAVELVFLPVGGGPTIGAPAAVAIVKTLKPCWVVPMHYRTPRIGFLETEEEFVAMMPAIEALAAARFETSALSEGEAALAVLPAAP